VLKDTVAVFGIGFSGSHGNVFTLSRAPYYSSAIIRDVILENRTWTDQEVVDAFIHN